MESRRIDEESPFEMERDELRDICRISADILREAKETHFKKPDTLNSLINKLASNFGLAFFENPLTSQFCDAVLIEKNLVMQDKDGKVKVFDVGEIDGEETKRKVEEYQTKRAHIAKLLEDVDAYEDKEQGKEQRAYIERKNGWYFHERPLRLDSEVLVDPGKDEIFIYPQPDNGFAYNFRGDAITRIKEFTGKEGVLRAEINRPFELKMGEVAVPDPSVLRVYGFEKLREMFEKK